MKPTSSPTFLRPSDKELDAGGGTLGCSGSDIWETLMAAVTGDTAKLGQLLQREPKLARAEYWYTAPLHFAVREGHVAAVELLLAYGADATATRYGGEDLVTVATDRGHLHLLPVLEAAQKKLLGPIAVDNALHTAVQNGNTQAARVLIVAQPGLVNVRDVKGRSPLHLAVVSGNAELVTLLMEMGADLEALTGAGDTYLPAGFSALDLAIWESDFWIGTRENWDMVSLLLDGGASYPITIAAARGDRDRVEELLQADSSLIEAPQPSGRRALSAAIQFGHLDLAELLLDAGANPNLPEGRYTPRGSALYFAARGRQSALVSRLLEAGADPAGGIDSCGLVWQVADEMTRLQLYRYGLTITEVDVHNGDALALWAENDPEGLSVAGCGTIFTSIVCKDWSGAENPLSDEHKEALLLMLLAKGVKVPPVVTGCRSYLWHKPKLTRILLEHGMDPNLPNWQQVTPLHNVCGLGGRGEPDENRLELAALFLEFGANINARDEEYKSTPLGWAMRCGLLDMVRFLLQNGATIQLPDDEPWATPLAWAKRRGHGEIVELLQSTGTPVS